jgi:hypothetical protein
MMDDDPENLGAIPISDYHHGVTTDGSAYAIGQMMIETDDDPEEQQTETPPSAKQVIEDARMAIRDTRKQLQELKDEIETKLESDDSSEDGGPTPIEYTKVTRIYKNSFTMVTLCWREITCQTLCELGTQHTHTIYDEEIEPKEYARTITIQICRNDECQEKENLHAHQGNDNKVLTLRVPANVERIFRPDTPETQSLSSMSDEVRLPLFDERGNPEYMHRKFRCTDVDCVLRHVPHLHMKNVDPEEPHIGIRKEVFDDFVLQGMTCNDEDCPWNEDAHIHIPKNL